MNELQMRGFPNKHIFILSLNVSKGIQTSIWRHAEGDVCLRQLHFYSKKRLYDTQKHMPRFKVTSATMNDLCGPCNLHLIDKGLFDMQDNVLPCQGI